MWASAMRFTEKPQDSPCVSVETANVTERQIGPVYFR